ncbi:1-phosphatidylinositol phosphodiesterase-like [Coturnix japonica]|uniref:1-phosphatidylinositol phosphodiesterase-like n=1 Tax=Coturnix japonica TaxID=93934 RepID=A0A8C2UJJ2_COTJA|nr:1-phosphatidylinositol phosphodiesterase-like [Coturnix japonica]
MDARCRRNAAFDNTAEPAAYRPDWMAALPDTLPLSRISIPGTHDSLSLFGGCRLRCQSWGLEAQLEAGVRFLDVRCKLERGELRIYHLCTFQRVSLRGVLRRTLRFLRAHPGEAVLMRIKEEMPIFPRPRFAARLQRCLLEESRGRLWCREEVPTLGQVRGKIVVLEALEQAVLGIPYERLSISDAWNVLSLERKWARAQRHLDTAASGDPATMHLTFCSGNGLFTCPEDVARFVNPQCYQHLQCCSGQPVCWGVVILDFPGAGLLQLIIESNNTSGTNGSVPEAPSTPQTSQRQRRQTLRVAPLGPVSPVLRAASRVSRRTSMRKGARRSCTALRHLYVTSV